jgi:hypothetical protein
MEHDAETAYQIIRQAIIERRSLNAAYDGYLRFFSPVTLGRCHDGEAGVIVYQYAGRRPEGRLPRQGDWACFRVRRLHWLQHNGDRWLEGALGSKPTGFLSRTDVSA